uniref:Uncharacterized protein n=1 Tax=Rhizophora mucronata TaxID=61149 RepID=A0A2P2JVM4_RHIMU
MVTYLDKLLDILQQGIKFPCILYLDFILYFITVLSGHHTVTVFSSSFLFACFFGSFFLSLKFDNSLPTLNCFFSLIHQLTLFSCMRLNDGCKLCFVDCQDCLCWF